MPAVSVTEVFNTHVTSTMRAWYLDNPVDVIFNGNLFMAIMFGAEKLPGSENVLGVQGGRLIETSGRKVAMPVAYNKSTNTTSFRGLDTVPLNVDDPVTMAEAEWAYYTDSVVLMKTEARENQGEAALFKILDARMRQANKTIKETIDGHLASTGDGGSGGTTGNDGRDIIGLQHLMPADPTTGTVWGIDRSLNTWWRSVYTAGGNTYANLGITPLLTMWNGISGTNGEDPPTFLLTTPAMFANYNGTVSGKQQIVTTRVGDLGFPTLEYMGRPIFRSSLVTAHNWYFINMNYAAFFKQPGEMFEVEEQSKPANQRLQGIWSILFAGQWGFERYDRQGRLAYTG